MPFPLFQILIAGHCGQLAIQDIELESCQVFQLQDEMQLGWAKVKGYSSGQARRVT